MHLFATIETDISLSSAADRLKFEIAWDRKMETKRDEAKKHEKPIALRILGKIQSKNSTRTTQKRVYTAFSSRATGALLLGDSNPLREPCTS